MNLKKRRKSRPSISKENNPLTRKDPDVYGGRRFHCMKVFQEICLLGFGYKLRLETIWRARNAVTIKRVAKDCLVTEQFKIFKKAFDKAEHGDRDGLIDYHTKSFQKMNQVITAATAKILNSATGVAGPIALIGATGDARRALGHKDGQLPVSLLNTFGKRPDGSPVFGVSSP
jgi:hypothetical protein